MYLLVFASLIAYLLAYFHFGVGMSDGGGH
jgi:hypothetical protein